MNIVPAPGRAIVEADREPDALKGIHLPDISKKGLLSGTVSDLRFGMPRKCKRCGRIQTINDKCRACGSPMRILSQKPYNPLGADVVGRRVVFNELSVYECEKNRYIVPVDTIVAILPADVAFDAKKTAHRCKFCGPAKAGTSNGLMMVADAKGEMYCPRCRKYANGATKAASAA